MRIITINLTAGVPTTLNMQASYFRLHMAAYPVDVYLTGGSQRYDYVAMEEGVQDRPDGGFQKIELTSANTQTIKIIVGQGTVQVDRLAGTVQVINGEIVRVQSNLAFIGALSQAALAANFSHTELWNPAGSGKNIFVTRVSMSLGAGGAAVGVALNSHTVALTTLAGNGLSKKFGGAASTAELRSQTNAATLGTVAASLTFLNANETREFPFAEPIMLPPGFGLVLVPGIVNVALVSNYQWFESVL